MRLSDAIEAMASALRSLATRVERLERAEHGAGNGAGGGGDMYKAVYDANNNGIVDAAESVAWANVTGKPATYPPSPHASTHHSGGSDPLALGAIAGTIGDSQHGTRGGGSLHALATSASAGFMAATDKAKLDGLPASAVPTSRVVATSAPLSGGGNLSADRTLTLNVDAHFQLSNNALSLRRDARPGNRLILLLEHGLRVDTEYITQTSSGGGINLQVNETFDPGAGTKTAGVLIGSIIFASPSGLQLVGNGLAVRVSSDAGNVLQLRGNGLYVPSALTGQIQVVAAGSVTLQPALSEGEYLYSNTRVTLSPAQPDANYTVMLSPVGAPAMTFVDNLAADGFTVWALIDTRLTAQAVTPTIAWFVVRW